ncbi:TPA: hypothetical protein ACPZUU_002677 [Yersinia enterocolitica]
MTSFHQRIPVQKYLYFSVLLKFRQSDDFRDHVDITHSPDIEIIAPMRDIGCIADVDIILRTRHIEAAITHREVHRPENIFVVFTLLEAQRILPNI